jgi:putative DNA primase/helicase
MSSYIPPGSQPPPEPPPDHPTARAPEAESTAAPPPDLDNVDDDDDDAEGQRSDALHIAVPCDPAGVPAFLRSLNRWFGWRGKPKLDRETSKFVGLDKIPVSFRSPKACNAQDRAEWSSFDRAAAVVARRDRLWDGLGITLGELAGLNEVLAGFDLDGCRDPVTGEIAPWAMDFLCAAASYAEVSPSGTGIKVPVRIKLADLPEVRRLLALADHENVRRRFFGDKVAGQPHAPHVEMWLGGKFFTVTGARWAAGPDDVTVLSIRQAELLAALFGPKTPAAAIRTTQRNGSVPASMADMVAAMRLIPASCGYADWLAIGMALYHETDGSLDALATWVDWSETCPAKFDGAKVLAKKWASFETRRETATCGAGTIYHHAKSHGWTRGDPHFADPGYQAALEEAAEQEAQRRARPLDHRQDHDPGPPPETPLDDPGPEPDADGAVTEQSVMRAFVAIHSGRLRFNHDSKQWLIYQGHYWRPDRRQLAFSWALDLCRARSTTATVQKVRFSSAVETGARAMREVSTAQEDWDANHWLLGASGGVVDLTTGELRAGRPEDMITRITGVTPAESPDCPRWLDFLNYAFHGNDKNILFLQRYFGYCLTGLTREEFFVMLFGEGGTGKGTMTETLRGVMGDYADVVPIEMFTSAQNWRPAEYYRATLAGKRLILAAEPPKGSVWSEAFINEMTGGDRLSARHPAGRPFDFTPTHKPLLHGNHMPKTHGLSSGLKRRLGILLVNRKPEKPDPTLKAALRSEYPAILRWGIEGCLAWQRRGLDVPSDVLAASADYFAMQDTFARWAEECCVLDPSLELKTGMLRGNFNAWAKASGEETMSTTDFSNAIDRFQGAKLRRVMLHGAHIVKGIGLQPSRSYHDPDSAP